MSYNIYDTIRGIYMYMKNILVTGGAGYIGSHTVYELRKHGYNCVILDNFSQGCHEFTKGCKTYDVDLKNISEIKKVFAENDFDAVIHFAAIAKIAQSVVSPQRYYYNNVVNTLNLLAVMREFHVKKIVFSSSCAIYGEPVYIPLSENHPKNPISPYGRSKLMVEHILRDYDKAYGIKYIALRYFNAAGASTEKNLGEIHSAETHIIPIILKTIDEPNEKFVIYGDQHHTLDGTSIRDYVHVEDLAYAHRLAVERLFSGSKSDVFNLGTGHGTSVREVISAVERVTGQEVSVEIGHPREGEPDILYASCSKARRVLGWQAKYENIDDIIRSAWEWEKKLKSAQSLSDIV